MNLLPFLQVPSSSQGSIWMPIITFGLVFVIFYFFIIRPQNKKQKDTEKMISAVKKGDKVVTIGGVHGEVTSTKEKTVIVKVDENCKIEFSRSAIATVEIDEKEAAKAEKPAKTAKKDKKDDSAEDPAEVK
jgi:preprotein translocase subunit YajC